MTMDEYVACRLLGMRICVSCFKEIDKNNRRYHCSACLTDSPPDHTPKMSRINHKCGVEACWEIEIRDKYPEAHSTILGQTPGVWM